MKTKFLWITDPWQTLDHSRDTTLRLMEESQSLGFQNHWCDVKSVCVRDRRVELASRRLKSVKTERQSSSFEFESARASRPAEFTHLLYRVDPPVDHAYLHPLQMLVAGLPGNLSKRIINPAATLALTNEKFEALALSKLMPDSLVSSDRVQLEEFGRKNQRVVLKLLYEAQSKGIELLDFSSDEQSAHAETRIEAALGVERKPILLQRFLTGIQEGESRLWFLDGRLLAAVKKLPKQGEFRINMDAGGTLAVTKLSRKDSAAARQITKLLRAKRIRLAAVDLIDGLITDFNHTSPGLIVQMEKLLGINLARKIVLALARNA